MVPNISGEIREAVLEALQSEAGKQVLQEALMKSLTQVVQAQTQPTVARVENPAWQEWAIELFKKDSVGGAVATGVVCRKTLPKVCETCNAENSFIEVDEPAPYLGMVVYKCTNGDCDHREYVFDQT